MAITTSGPRRSFSNRASDRSSKHSSQMFCMVLTPGTESRRAGWRGRSKCLAPATPQSPHRLGRVYTEDEERKKKRKDTDGEARSGDWRRSRFRLGRTTARVSSALRLSACCAMGKTDGAWVCRCESSRRGAEAGADG
eukprot:3848814-Rhodomonas_salina.1